MRIADNIDSVHEPSVRSDAAYAQSVDASLASEAGERARNWHPMPGELVSLWDILLEYAQYFVVLTGCLLEVEKLLALSHKTERQEIDLAIFSEMLEKMQAALENLHLGVSLSQIKHMQDAIGARTDLQSLAESFRALRSRIEDELGERLFLYVPQERAMYWSEEPQFSKKAQRVFKKAIDDMVEAGRCLAVGRFTACVFHLMRVVEIGTKKFVKKLPGLTLSHKDTLGQIARKISNAASTMPSSTRQETERKEAFGRTADHLCNISDGWRNKTMHAGLCYNEEQATILFKNTVEFMQHLADLK